MADSQTATDIDRLSPAEIDATMGSIKKMLIVGGLFAAVGYLLVGSALFFELTNFHPALDAFASQNPNHSLAGGGPERSAAVSSQLASLHKWPSTLLWLKLGGMAHVLVGIFVALAAIVRTLSLVPHRLSYEMERTGGAAAGRMETPTETSSDPSGPGTPADD